MAHPVLRAENLKQHYTINGGLFKSEAKLKALDGVSFSLHSGKTLAVVGESGCGKSTLARLVTMVESPTEGEIYIDGIALDTKDEAAKSKLRSSIQMVFQNPYSSLNPRQKIGTILEEPLLINRPDISKNEREEKARKMLELVGLRPEHYARYPHMFSGGQRQRIAIARALMLDPKLIVLDEPVSALDLSVQAQVLNLLVELQERLQLAYLFISHDLSVVKHMADEIIVIYLGKPVEFGTAEQIFNNPKHPYTQALLSATPIADPTKKRERIKLEGELPSPLNPPQGCAFNPRCRNASDQCRQENPSISPLEGREVACFNPV
jgi:dipeptide transport system ATP-binding protein